MSELEAVLVDDDLASRSSRTVAGVCSEVEEFALFQDIAFRVFDACLRIGSQTVGNEMMHFTKSSDRTIANRICNEHHTFGETGRKSDCSLVTARVDDEVAGNCDRHVLYPYGLELREMNRFGSDNLFIRYLDVDVNS
ncbi:hypothetical protein Ab1vBOLIVR5_gp229c [Agrobacterium phage OLIVR5]|uniref:Uncharacterized protein n=1 Tax=Agrobacterium phage OLIVR5 TaxID=2723773 RepID=A0A858MSX5_9CAUD|nr:hypothetical protein KNU99_gp172 [Agrobacterium phage OLIVR5]QIW87877.1 hypothetical protein Ab1vBOLIVR5_gp229c [Agrobacterium phage OLIVR5]QIW88142.1 hypothetical protein Ab1vBOLIVR6_gp235c [Agrobacterium phage OLIVR6]